MWVLWLSCTVALGHHLVLFFHPSHICIYLEPKALSNPKSMRANKKWPPFSRSLLKRNGCILVMNIQNSWRRGMRMEKHISSLGVVRRGCDKWVGVERVFVWESWWGHGNGCGWSCYNLGRQNRKTEARSVLSSGRGTWQNREEGDLVTGSREINQTLSEGVFLSFSWSHT